MEVRSQVKCYFLLLLLSINSCSGWPMNTNNIEETRRDLLNSGKELLPLLVTQQMANTLIDFYQTITNILNANTTFNSLDRTVDAFNKAQNSFGGYASFTLTNALGNSFVLFDAIGNTLERWKLRIKSIQAKLGEVNQDPDETSQDDDLVTDFLDKLKDKFEAISKKLLCGHPMEAEPFCSSPLTTITEESEEESDDNMLTADY